jgi:superfamily I DNA and/or RNA helicase
MNLFHLNTGVDNKVLLNADYDIRRYTDFINKSIELLKRETLSIKVTKEVVEGETRYIPEIPSNKKSEKAIDLLFNENTKNIFDQRTSFNRNDFIEISDQNEDENYITLRNDIKGDTIYLNPDTYQLEQQRKALQEHKPLLELFGFPESSIWQQSFYEKDCIWQILTDETKDGVYEQREFVSKGLQTKDFALMEGPPGSGKTTTIIELIMQFTAEGKRVLLCSATHAAIDNVIERIKGRYKDICDKEIVPLRISRFEKPVKESVRPYLLRNLVATYKADIEKHLKKNQALESQKFLLKNFNCKADIDLNYYKIPLTGIFKHDQNELRRIDKLKNKYELQTYLSNKQSQVRNDEENLNRLQELQQELISDIDPIEKTILDSANLVAGTMVGILQHPDIRANKQGASFDVLIVDEASKVTFSDFIVPALHAKKWILVGDVKQLSPYVENDYVSENIATMLEDEIQKSIVKQFELKSKLDDKKFEDCLKVFFTDQNPNSEKQFIENVDLVIESVDEN